MKIRWKLPLALALTTLIFAGIVTMASALLLQGVFFGRLQDDMSHQAHEYATVLESLPAGSATSSAELEKLTQQVGRAGEVRFTLIAHDGKVLADSDVNPATLENHASRPEVKQALLGREGRARRTSATEKREEVYVAIPLPEGNSGWSKGVLRAAVPASRIDAMLSASWRIPLIVWAILLLPTLAAAFLLTRSITRDLERLRRMTSKVASNELGYRNSVRRSDELGDLGTSLNTMATRLESRDYELTAEMERSDQVLAAMGDGVLLVDGDGRLLRHNPAAGRILGVNLDQAEGNPLVFAARAFPVQALAEKAAEAGHPVTEAVELPGGRFLNIEVAPLSTTGTTPGQTLFVIRDETTRKAVERMRRDFVTNVSHELKTPLAGLSLLSETLAHAVREDPQQAEVFVHQLDHEVKRLIELTRDLLTLSRLEEPEAGQQSDFEVIDMVDLSLNAATEAEAMAEAKSQELTFDLPSEALVRGDAVALRTLIRNLLNNAVRYTDAQGHIRLAIALEQIDDEDWVMLRVTDDGAGIPLAEQERIFERFYRVDKARSRETGGTGLGLSIVRHVAERHGGNVRVTSTVGVGSTFTVRIPSASHEATCL
jgi:two-component system phosphate regulon sensor histidine kinase PhoR